MIILRGKDDLQSTVLKMVRIFNEESYVGGFPVQLQLSKKGDEVILKARYYDEEEYLLFCGDLKSNIIWQDFTKAIMLSGFLKMYEDAKQFKTNLI